MLRRCALLLLPLVPLLCVAFPARALASAYTQIQSAYAKSSSGTIAACQFSSAELQAALTEAPSYDYQYGADVTDAIQAALAARANGQCRHATAAAPAGSLGPAATLQGAPDRLPGSVGSAGSSAGPVLTIVLAVAGFGLLLACGWLGVSALGFEPRWRRALGHSLREAEYRISAGWSDLTERLRH